MKACITCRINKELSEFYKHKDMVDGHLNKCKECCKLHSKERIDRLRSDPNFVEKEKARHRDKYHRLGYKEKHKPSYESKKAIMSRYKTKYPEKALSRNAVARMEKKEGFELHHWSYNEEHHRDVIELPIKEHSLLHRHMIYDSTEKMYRNSRGELLNTKQSHIDLLAEIVQ